MSNAKSKWASKTVNDRVIEKYVSVAKLLPNWPKKNLALLVIEQRGAVAKVFAMTRKFLADEVQLQGWSEEEAGLILKAPLGLEPVVFCGLDDVVELAYMDRAHLVGFQGTRGIA